MRLAGTDGETGSQRQEDSTLLRRVVEAYIGETEKSLVRIVDTADSIDEVLFIDEGEALYGRRTNIRSAHDRYSNPKERQSTEGDTNEWQTFRRS